MERNNDQEIWKFKVQFEDKFFTVMLHNAAIVYDLKSCIHSTTNIPPYAQKLSISGTILEDHLALRSLQISNEYPFIVEHDRGSDQEKERRGKRLVGFLVGDDGCIRMAVTEKMVQHWKITGIVSVSELNLLAIPEQVWKVGSNVMLLDVSDNCISDIPKNIYRLSSLETLLINENVLRADNIDWEGLAKLKSLAFLNLSRNSLKYLPKEVGGVKSLRKLYLSDNILEEISPEIGGLTHLQILRLDHNCLSALPETLGDCISLTDIDLSGNAIDELPKRVCLLKDLKVLNLKENPIRSLPCGLFKMCEKLVTLDIRKTSINLEEISQFDGVDDRLRSCVSFQSDSWTYPSN